MSDNDKSGAPNPASADLPANAPASAETHAAPAAAFGSTRGSGLARGKRPAHPASGSPAPTTPGAYKPTAIEVITPQSEYKNPFTGETTVVSVTPPTNEPTPSAAPAALPRTIAGDAPPAETKPAAPAAAAPSAKMESPEAGAKPLFPYEGDNKPELNILPPEPAKRPSVSWEASGTAPAADTPAPRRDERPTFRPEQRGDRREGRTGDPREPREFRDSREPREPRQPREGGREPRSFEPREPRRDDRKFEPRAQPYREPRPEQPAPVKQAGGFLGWLKGLFGGSASPAPSAGGQHEADTRRDGDRGRDGHPRHRGGRGRGGQGGGYRDENRGPRGEGQSGGGDPRSGESRGDGDHGGHRRRRRRGGRGRFRGEGGPRPEGQQGGGAI